METINIKKIETLNQREDSALSLQLSFGVNKEMGDFLAVRSEKDELLLCIYPRKGNNFLIKCNNLKELKQCADKIILNMNKRMLEGLEPSLECTLSAEDKKNKRIKMQGIPHKLDPEYLEEVDRLQDEKRKLYAIKSNDLEEKNKIRSKIIDIENKISRLSKEGKSAIITNLENITVCDKKLEKIRDVVNYLIDESNISTDPNKKIIDLNKNNYTTYIQDILMQNMYDEKINLTKEQAEAIRNFKFCSVDINLFLRGETNEINDKIFNNILGIAKSFEIMPKTKQDIVLYRGGSSIKKNKEIGSKNEWNHPVSFSTIESVSDIFSEGVKYKTILKAGSTAIPVDILSGINWNRQSENEMILPPLMYKIENRKKIPEKYGEELDINFIEFRDLKSILEARLKESKEIIDKKIIEMKESKTRLENIDVEKDKKEFELMGYDESKLQDEQLDIFEVVENLENKGKLEEILIKDSIIQEDDLQYQSYLHGTNHTRKVSFFANILAEEGNLDKKDKNVLMSAVQFHDIGRENDFEDKEHGANSVKKLEKNTNVLYMFDEQDRDLIKFIIAQHCKSKKENEEALSKLEESKKTRYEKLLNYMKDADKLDRVRLGRYDGLDQSRLSMPISQKMVKLAYQTDKYLFDIINTKNEDKDITQQKRYEKYLKVLENEKFETTEKIEEEKLVYFDDENIKPKEKSDNIVKKERPINWMEKFKKCYNHVYKDSAKASNIIEKNNFIRYLKNKKKKQKLKRQKVNINNIDTH